MNKAILFVLMTLSVACNAGEKERMYDAARAGNLPAVQQLLNSGFTIDTPVDYLGQTVLHIAAFNGYQPIVEFLIMRGAKIDSINPRRETPLSQAVSAGYPQIVKLLLDNGANFNHKDIDGNSVLMYATSPGIVKILLEKGASFNTVNDNGKTALDFATNGKTGQAHEIKNLLIKAGAKTGEQVREEQKKKKS